MDSLDHAKKLVGHWQHLYYFTYNVFDNNCELKYEKAGLNFYCLSDGSFYLYDGKDFLMKTDWCLEEHGGPKDMEYFYYLKMDSCTKGYIMGFNMHGSLMFCENELLINGIVQHGTDDVFSWSPLPEDLSFLPQDDMGETGERNTGVSGDPVAAY